MEYLLLFLAVLLIGGTVFLLVGSGRRGLEPGSGPSRGPGVPGELVGLAEPLAALPPVLLPERPRAGDVERLRLGVGLRGYRGDQVDEVLDVLAAEIERLHAELAEARRNPVISATNHSPE